MKQNEYNVSKITIEVNVPKPPKAGGRDNKWFMLFVKLKINDSFAIPFENEAEATKIRNAIVGARRQYKFKHDSNFMLSTRILHIKKEVRAWRDK